ncbi:MAG: hypothetical protein NTY19_29075 [Planctomycetota bacterium]|nr:hypothetical protein [Planctomycetota bacterium]
MPNSRIHPPAVGPLAGFCGQLLLPHRDVVNPAPADREVTAVATPRDTAVSSLTIVFSEAVTGLDLADLSLTRDGGGKLLTADHHRQSHLDARRTVGPDRRAARLSTHADRAGVRHPGRGREPVGRRRHAPLDLRSRADGYQPDARQRG